MSLPITIDKLKEIIGMISTDHDNVQLVIEKFGIPTFDNGYGTIFLEPFDKNLTYFWIAIDLNKIRAFGFGGNGFDITLFDLVNSFPIMTSGFSIYDDQYEYVFTSSSSNCIIKIFSKEKLFYEKEAVANIMINEFHITLK